MVFTVCLMMRNQSKRGVVYSMCFCDDERCELKAEDNFCENSGVFMMKFVKNNKKAFTCERASLL